MLISDRRVFKEGDVQQLGSAEYVVRWVKILAEHKNIGILYIGNSEVSEENGYPLLPGDSIELDYYDLGTIFLYSDTNDARASYLAVIT